MVFYVLTKESRMTPGDQTLLMGSFDRAKIEAEKEKGLKHNIEEIGIKLYYLYKIHEVEVIE